MNEPFVSVYTGSLMAGVDEVGRGPLAGDVVVCGWWGLVRMWLSMMVIVIALALRLRMVRTLLRGLRFSRLTRAGCH